MAEAADFEGLCGELYFDGSLHLHSYEAEPHHRDYTVPQRLRRAVGLLLRQDMDQFPREGRYAQAAVYPAREHCYSDLRRCLLWHCFQRYAIYFVETYTLDNTWPSMHAYVCLFIYFFKTSLL